MSHPGSQSPSSASHTRGEGLPEIDVRERGAEKDGQPQVMDRRLFMQLLAFRIEKPESLKLRDIPAALQASHVPAVVYEDVNDPLGFAVLTWSEDPAHFVTTVRPILSDPNLVLPPALTMLGRTYSTGFEQELPFWLLERPVQTVLIERCPWAVWYPLRRSGAFSKLEPKEQGAILREHGTIGRAYGAQDLAHDVRLACHGLDANDNEFVIGLVGKELHPLSHIVQSMRKTRQTSEFINQMGPFFVGHVAYRSTGA